MQISPRTVSRAIVAVLALQLLAASRVLCTPKDLAGLPSIHLACPPALFPFLDYPMFRARFRYGERLEFRRVIGVDARGAEHRIAPRRGEEARAIEASIGPALRGDDRDLRNRLAAARAPGGERWSAARIEEVELVLGRRGFVEERCEVLARIADLGTRP